MADFDEDISIDSDDDEYLDNDNSSDKNSYSQNGKRFATDAERRAHHNALERKRRDQIKSSFIYLRDSIPSLKGEKPSRAQILKKASEYIDMMDMKRQSHRQDIVRLKKQIRQLERAEHRLAQDDSPEVNVDSDSEDTGDSSSTEETNNP